MNLQNSKKTKDDLCLSFWWSMKRAEMTFSIDIIRIAAVIFPLYCRQCESDVIDNFEWLALQRRRRRSARKFGYRSANIFHQFRSANRTINRVSRIGPEKYAPSICPMGGTSQRISRVCTSKARCVGGSNVVIIRPRVYDRQLRAYKVTR